MLNLPLNDLISKISGRVPLRTMIVIPFVVLVALAGGITGYLSLRNGQEAVNNVASQLRNEVTARIQERVRNYLETAHLVNELNVNAIELEQLNLQNTDNMKEFFWKEIQSFGEVTNTFVGLPNGTFVGASGLGESTPQIILADETTGGSLNYYDTDVEGKLKPQPAKSAQNYDPRVRAWYTVAVDKKKPIWSEVYPEFTTKALAITAAQPVYDRQKNLLGVLGSTAIFTDVDKFLHNLKIGKQGQTFIMERSGKLVSTSTSALTFSIKEVQREDGKLDTVSERILAHNSEVDLIKKTAGYLQARFDRDLTKISESSQLDFEIEGEKQFIQVTPLKDDRGLDWLVVVTIPEADFMEQIQSNTRITIWLSLIALILTTIVGLFTARGIIQPILRLNMATKRFAEGHWDEKLPTGRTDELGDLARSFNVMEEQVKQSFAALEEANATLERRVQERTQELAKALDDLKASQAQLVQNEKMASLGQMVAGVAHEINTPLGYVRSNVEMTRDLFNETENLAHEYETLLNLMVTEGVGEEELNEQVIAVSELTSSFREDETFEETRALYADILHGLDQISELVLNLKDFSRVDSVRVRDVSLNECLNSVLVIGNNVIGAKIEIVKEYNDVPFIQCSPSHINQVFLNIITNAAQAIEDRGKITLRTYAEGEWVRVEIQDSGKGIPEDIRSKIFDPFFTTKPIGQGTGLGLSISYQIIEQHHGQIEVASEVGKGTTFKISLPRQTS